MSEVRKPRILFLDIESLTDLKAVMEVFPSLSDYPGLTLKASHNSIICFGYKWLDEKAKCIKAWDYRGWRKNVNDDKLLVRDAMKIVNEADVIVTYNGKGFDAKFLLTRLVKNGYRPQELPIHVDMKNVVKKNFFLLNNRLKTVCKHFLDDNKKDHEGWPLWVKVGQRNKRAMKEMVDYNIQDVVVLEKLFKKMLPLINQIPNHNIYTDGAYKCCVNCGSARLIKKGIRPTRTGKVREYQCKDCGKYSREKIKIHKLILK